MAGSPTFFSDGNTPNITDTTRKATLKILGALIDGAGSGGVVAGTFIQTGDGINPPTNAAQKAVYYPDGGGDILTWSVGAQSWK